MKKILLQLLVLITTNAFGQAEYYITSFDQTRLYVQEFGGGEPLILLAGGPGLNADYMNRIWENLSFDYRCIVLNQRGTGQSILPEVDSASFTMENYIHDLEALRRHLELDQLTLIGHSWGGMLAMEYAASHPENLKKLILLGPGGPTIKFFSYFPDNVRMRLCDENTLDWSGYFFDREKATDLKTSEGQPGVYQYAFASYSSSEDERVDLLRNFNGIVHIIQGRQDPVGESTVYEIKELLPQSRIHFIEKCGHFPWLENENQVREFYDQLRGSLK